MEPALADRTAAGAPAKYHGAWSVNVSRDIAAGVSAASWSDGVTQALRGMGCVLAESPDGHVNPEATRQPVGAGTDRFVWTVQAWFTANRMIQGRDLNLRVAEAFRNAGAGRDFPAADAARAMANCETVREVQVRTQGVARTTAENLVPFYSAYRSLFADVGTACASYEAYAGAPRANVSLGSAVGRAAAGPIDASNNPLRIGESPVVFEIGGLGLTGTELKVIGAVVGGVALLATAGYFLRSVKVVTL